MVLPGKARSLSLTEVEVFTSSPEPVDFLNTALYAPQAWPGWDGRVDHNLATVPWGVKKQRYYAAGVPVAMVAGDCRTGEQPSA